MVNARKLHIRLTIFLAFIFTLFFNSCSKELVVDLEGEWIIVPSNVFIGFTYNPDISENPENIDSEKMLELIKGVLNEAENELKKLVSITFIPATSNAENNIVQFKYNNDSQPVYGTYEQNIVYFTLVNPTFPDGILGLCNNYELEIYYSRDYLLNTLHNIIALNNDIERETINAFIEDISGVGYYIRK